MRITLVGSRHFGVTTLQMLRQHEVDVIRVVVADKVTPLSFYAFDGTAGAASTTGGRVLVRHKYAV